MTELHVAAQSGRAGLVRYLLGKGANPASADSNGRKPIDLVGGTPATRLLPRILPAVWRTTNGGAQTGSH